MFDMPTIKFRALVSTFFFFPISAVSEPLATAPDFDPPLGRLIIGLLLCVFLAYAVIHVLRNIQRGKGPVRNLPGLKFKGAGQGTNQISVLETHRLNATSDVCLITWKQKEFLIIVGAHEPKLLKENDSYSENSMVVEEKK